MTHETRDPAHREGRLIPRPNGWWRSYNIEIVDVGDPEHPQITQVIPVKPWIYLVVCGGYGLLQLALAVVSAEFWSAPMFSLFGTVWGWGEVLAALQLAHFIFSFTYIRQDEFGGFFFFGSAVMETLPGLKFRPLLLLQLPTITRKVIQAQFPGDPELVFKQPDEQFFALSRSEREKLVLPIRATTGEPAARQERRESRDESALDSQMTLEVTFYVRWRVLHFFTYVIRVGTVAEGLRQMRDSGERIIIQEVASRTPRRVIKELGGINRALADTLLEITTDWGAHVTETALLAPDLTHDVNVALRNVVVKKAEATQVKVTARAEEVRLTREGRGRAEAKLAEFRAMADGAQAIGVQGQSVVDLEKARAVAGENTTIFLDGGRSAGNLLGIGARLAAGGEEAVARGQRRRRDRPARNRENEGGNA